MSRLWTETVIRQTACALAAKLRNPRERRQVAGDAEFALSELRAQAVVELRDRTAALEAQVQALRAAHERIHLYLDVAGIERHCTTEDSDGDLLPRVLDLACQRALDRQRIAALRHRINDLEAENQRLRQHAIPAEAKGASR